MVRAVRLPVVHLLAIANQTYLVSLKAPNLPLQQVVAATVEVHGEHLLFSLPTASWQRFLFWI
jgi:hypothetical protein